jgi:cyclopropane-fatty-acyl-phospholipid synthase
MLKHLSHGRLALTLPNGAHLNFGSDKTKGPVADLTVKNWSVFQNALKSGDIGFAESYIAGDWETTGLTALLELFIVNRIAVERVIYGSWVGRLYYLFKHWTRRNNKTNSTKNIHAHYDLGNSFYQIWLDETMTYSSALFDSAQDISLAQAQRAKIQRACRMVGLQKGSALNVLEIGCGWGSLAEVVSHDFQCAHTGVTLSPSQLEYARQRLSQKQLTADLRLQDYRDITDPPFDAILSIEMFEAVGKEYWSTYFKNVHRLLKPGARACIQTIVIEDSLFDQYIKGTDFIQQYIFPGGCLPCPARFRQLAAEHGLQVIDEFCFGLDYAATLKEWRRVFTQESTQVRKLGFDDAFMKTWEFYLCYCEAGFNQHNLDVIQFTLQKPQA